MTNEKLEDKIRELQSLIVGETETVYTSNENRGIELGKYIFETYYNKEYNSIFLPPFRSVYEALHSDSRKNIDDLIREANKQYEVSITDAKTISDCREPKIAELNNAINVLYKLVNNQNYSYSNKFFKKDNRCDIVGRTIAEVYLPINNGSPIKEINTALHILNKSLDTKKKFGKESDKAQEFARELIEVIPLRLGIDTVDKILKAVKNIRVNYKPIQLVNYNDHMGASNILIKNGFNEDGLINYDPTFYQHNLWFPGPIDNPF